MVEYVARIAGIVDSKQSFMILDRIRYGLRLVCTYIEDCKKHDISY